MLPDLDKLPNAGPESAAGLCGRLQNRFLQVRYLPCWSAFFLAFGLDPEQQVVGALSSSFALHVDRSAAEHRRSSQIRPQANLAAPNGDQPLSDAAEDS